MLSIDYAIIYDAIRLISLINDVLVVNKFLTSLSIL